MRGDGKRRFCDLCQLHVHNLTATSAAEREALLVQRGTRQCIAYVAGGHSIRVRTGTWLFLQRFLRPWRAGLALIAVLRSRSGYSWRVRRHVRHCLHRQVPMLANKRRFSLTVNAARRTHDQPPLWRRI